MNTSHKRIITTLLCLILIFSISIAYAGEEKSLPIELTPDELLRLDEIGINHVRSDPPPGDIRNCGEWEPSEGVIVRYPLGIPIGLIAEMSEDLIIYTIVSSGSYNSAISSYTSGGVNMGNTEFIISSTNSYWTRDYGPWFIFDGTGEMGIIDHIYNRPRPLDDAIPSVIADEWDMNIYGMDLIHTGGNHMSNGLGVSISTELTYNENPSLSESEVDSIMLAFLGNDYTVLAYIESGGIHHIDCWAKFLDPTTILVKDVPTSSPSYNLLNQRADYLSEQISPWGKPYTVLRVYCPYGTAYTNSIILNNKVFIPFFGGSDAQADDDAFAVYREAMPGYEILGFYGSWLDDDAIHCRLMGVPDREMLYVHHVPLLTTSDTLNDYEVSARIVDHSQTGLFLDSLMIIYKTYSGSKCDTAALFATANPDSFVGYIPAQPGGTEIQYYIQASDYSGRVETHPYIGSAGQHKFNVNMVPEIISPDSITCKTESEFKYYPEFNDIDDTAHLIEYSGYPGWLTLQNDSLIGTSPATAGEIVFSVEVSDSLSTGQQDVKVMVYLCGDVEVDGQVDLLDVLYLITYKYKDGPVPGIMDAGDVNNDDNVDLLDILYLINYKYKDGPEPICP